MTTHPQLTSLRRELDEARRRAHDLAARAGPDRWTRQPPAGGWSVGHCVEHLNITSESFLPRLERACGDAGRADPRAGREYRLDLVGWLFCRLLEPPYRIRVKTPPPFDPLHPGSPVAVLARFDGLQARLDALVAGGDDLALDRIRVISPFNTHVKYSVWSALRIIPAHQRRHLWQAERVLEALDTG